MERVIYYEIEKENSDIKISQLLRAKGFSHQNLVDLKKREDSISVNGRQCFQNYVVKTGDIVKVDILETESSKHIPPVNLPIDIVYEDEDLMVLNKPAKMPVHTSMNNYDNTMANALAYYFWQQNTPFVFRCINRLDRDTSGLTIVAKHSVSAGILGTMIAAKSEGLRENEKKTIPNTSNPYLQEEKRYISREYLAIVKGENLEDEGTIDAPIARTGVSIIKRGVDFDKGESAVTHYKVLKRENGYSLVSLILETGRTHQIRVHMKYLGYPLIGDYLYNPDMEKISRQALHSYRLSFWHPMTGEKMTFTAPLPQDMSQIISWNC